MGNRLSEKYRRSEGGFASGPGLSLRLRADCGISNDTLGEMNIPKVRQLNKGNSHHGRQISEVGAETGVAKAVEGERHESAEAGADYPATGDKGKGCCSQEIGASALDFRVVESAEWPPGLFPVRGLMSVTHLLVHADGVVILDTGFPGDAVRIRRRIETLGAGPGDVRAILLTHGHIDHAGGLKDLQDWTGAPVYAHPLEQAHIDGRFPYSGLARLCGFLEAAGRAVTRHRPGRIDVPIADGDELPFWGGLRVVHLPGHTLGHCGFFSAKFNLLLSGDLWVRAMMRTQASPRIFSDDVSLVPGSMRKARALGARWVIPGHYDVPDATQLRRRFEQLCDDLDWAERSSVV